MATLKDVTDYKFSRENNFVVVMLYLNLHILSFCAPFVIKDAGISTYIFGKIIFFIIINKQALLKPNIAGLLLIWLGVLGASAGAHRLWAHKSYAADIKLRIFLMICFCISGQGTIYNWVLEHRLHHKYFGTKKDPFNHGKSIWNLQTLSRITKPVGGYDKLKDAVDMSDVEEDGVVMFQKKYFAILYIIFALLLPINAPAEYWGEGLWESFFIIGILRYLITLHLISLIETSSKIRGCSYNIKDDNDKKLVDTIEKMDWVTYHYIAPWDYQANEFGFYGNDITSLFIRICERVRLANSLKTMDGHIIGQAIQMSMDTNKSVTDCLKDGRFIDAGHSPFLQSHSLIRS
ncbi:acyl-coa desaturase [Holotrichia oblita]|uniref:Acyl-coa desaturase n=1 Tax=Holotrichia oblita TaxID=644536 RepID=A0ACB9SZD0_HOLOL|nr:acyl-coa desaturase [Holotrichia oblita]